VIPVTPSIPNRHTRATIRIADACHDQARLIATRITLNTGIAKTRHTTLTWVERNFGYAVARAYAGHTDSGSEAGTTSTCVRASLAEVAAALAALTGEPHPLATMEGW
jgi:hypothetical protein